MMNNNSMAGALGMLKLGQSQVLGSLPSNDASALGATASFVPSVGLGYNLPFQGFGYNTLSVQPLSAAATIPQLYQAALRSDAVNLNNLYLSPALNTKLALLQAQQSLLQQQMACTPGLTRAESLPSVTTILDHSKEDSICSFPVAIRAASLPSFGGLTRKRLSQDHNSGHISPPLTSCSLENNSMSPSKKPRRVEYDRPIVKAMRTFPYPKSPRQTKHGLGGERRLNISFLNTGKHIEPPQSFGKYGLVIPDGICGTHTMYAQHWKFEITHHTGKSGEVLLRWSITNLSSGAVTAMTETTEQAFQRQTKGNTICNIVVREALNHRAYELEEEIRSNERISNFTRVANLKSLVKELRPKQCTEGLLFFGLRHEAVQVKAAAALRAM